MLLVYENRNTGVSAVSAVSDNMLPLFYCLRLSAPPALLKSSSLLHPQENISFPAAGLQHSEWNPDFSHKVHQYKNLDDHMSASDMEKSSYFRHRQDWYKRYISVSVKVLSMQHLTIPCDTSTWFLEILPPRSF